ncbi:MAG TPA: MBOAT family O-acyltransferase [Lachnospiraceae bacterium]|nr:MBOAT family O-acyltransferase [Lachnospiraceae bacterium]
MSFVSVHFLIFTAICVAGYFIIPKKWQWIWLLLFSYLYYMAAGVRFLFFILFSTVVTYIGGLWAEKGYRSVVPLALVLDFGMLAAVKYTNFMVGNINGLFGTNLREFSLILPLGISFYTFQSAGYLLDVLWKRCKAERNPFRFALFISFFPQILQGPIGRMSRLAPQLYAEHTFDIRRLERGMLRIAWGYFKKMVIADNAALYVNVIFDNFDTMPGYGILGVLMYSAQLYADFSGGIDIVIGISDMLGIGLDENFRQPFFAVSITDFWHRWHITLGTWMKDYVFYPISLSGWMGRFGKFCRRKMNKDVGRALPICLANILVFLVVGIWHGPAWHYIVYGLYNGAIIAASGLLAKPYRKAKKALHISDGSRGFRVFQILRTFMLVNISWYFDRSGSIRQALVMMRDSILKFRFSSSVVSSDSTWAGSSAAVFLCVIFGMAVVFFVSVQKERKKDVAGAILSKPLPVRFVLLLALVLCLVLLGNRPLSVGGFIYANF